MGRMGTGGFIGLLPLTGKGFIPPLGAPPIPPFIPLPMVGEKPEGEAPKEAAGLPNPPEEVLNPGFMPAGGAPNAIFGEEAAPLLNLSPMEGGVAGGAIEPPPTAAKGPRPSSTKKGPIAIVAPPAREG